MFSNMKLFTVVTLQVLFVSACGGGSGGATSTKDQVVLKKTSTQDSLWTRGEFKVAATYKDQCETPRSGIDPYTNQAYPDKSGTAMQEKMWLRSWSDDTYLWYNEITDVDPTPFSVDSYFDRLKTTQRDNAGNLKDNFHFTQNTEEYNDSSKGGIVTGYGIDWNFAQNTSPRKLIVNFVEDNSPAANAGITRGLTLKEIDGIDFINTNTSARIDDINDALFPKSLNQSHTFTFNDINDNEVEFTMASANIVPNYVHNTKIISVGERDFGYFQFNAFNRNAQGELINAFETFSNSNITDLVIDLRYNGGGLLALSSQLAYMVAGSAQTNNLNFETTQFNNKYPTKDPITNQTLTPMPFLDKEIDWDLGVFTTTDLPSVNLATVYVLTTDNTCSASEALMNGLRGIDVDVIQIGAATCGKPYGFYPTDNCGTTYFTVQFKGVNNKGFGEYSTGFKPTPNPQYAAEVKGCEIEEDYSHTLGDENETLLASAIHYAETGSCPVQTQSRLSRLANEASDEDSIAIRTPNKLLQNKIYTLIKPAKN